MIPRLEKVNPIVAYEVDNSVFLSQPPRPCARGQVFQRLWLSDPGERISEDRLNKIEAPQREFPISFYPVPQVLAELLLKDGGSLVLFFTVSYQDQSHAGGQRPFANRLHHSRPAEGR